MKTRSYKVLSFMVVCLVFALVSPSAMAADSYKIGVSLGITGVQAWAAKPELDGAKLAAEIINSNGGIHGRPIELIVEDDQTKPEISVSKVNKLITKDKVLAIVGGNSGDCAMSIGAIAERQKVPFLSPTGFNHTDAQKSFKYSFLMIPDYDDGCEALSQYMVETANCKKLGLLRLTRLWGVTASNAFHALAKKYEFTIVREETLVDQDKDMTPQLTNIKAADPCAIAIWAAVPAAAISIKNARQLGIDVPLLGNPIFASKTTPEIAGAAADGVIGTATLVSTDPLPRQKDYVDSYFKKYNKPADMWDAACFDAIRLVAEAIKNLPPDKINRKSIRDQLEKIKGYQGAGAVVDFTKQHWPLSESWIMITIKDGKAMRLSSK